MSIIDFVWVVLKQRRLRMPIHKRDRNFQNIVSELDIKSIPTEYIQNIGLIGKDGYRVQFKGKEISATRLYRIYKQNGVKYKSVRIQK